MPLTTARFGLRRKKCQQCNPSGMPCTWSILLPLKKSLDHARMLRNLLARARRYSLYLARPRLRCRCTFRILFRLTSTEATS
ncbi:TPA: hypothetical protein I4D82_16045 [Enterobacter cloacae]|nr:hypothetical protein [Enterobacter cloacae]